MGLRLLKGEGDAGTQIKLATILPKQLTWEIDTDGLVLIWGDSYGCTEVLKRMIEKFLTIGF